MKSDIHFLGFPKEIFFGVTTDDLLHLKPLKNVIKNSICFKYYYSGTRFLSTENQNYSMSWWILS